VDVKPGAFRPPDGNQILFELGGPEDSGLYVMNADGTGRRAVLEQAAGSLGGSPNAARWSPDGRMIAFRVNVHVDPEQARLWVINAD
jgi:Tol biopolymer transport system component